MIKYLEKEVDFEKEISKRCLVDFYADWCGPCKMMGEVLETANLNIDILKVNTDKFPEISVKYGVMSIPTILLMNDGKVVKKNIGFMSEENLIEFIKE